MKLRTTLTAVMTGLGVLAVAVAMALVVVTSALNQAGVQLAGAMERVRLLMELESYALQHFRESPGADLRTAREIVDQLRETSDPSLVEDILALEAKIESVVTASSSAEREAEIDGLIGALRVVIAREDQEARRATMAAASWSRFGNATAAVAVVVLLLGVAGALVWLWRSALKPLMMVVGTIERFATGDVHARANVDGPGEVRQIALAFNGMADSLGRQREQQLAFVGGVAHDLRNPLGALQVAVTLLDRQSTDPARVRERVRRQVERLERMIGDLLDRTRIEAGEFALSIARCDLRGIVSGVVKAYEESCPARPFLLQLPDEPVVVPCDALRIEQVLNNLISNAMKYSPEESPVRVTLVCLEANAVLSVADRGIGIDDTAGARIFEPFRRGRNVGGVSGAGLGLSVTRRIVEAHGGRIEFRSERGSETVFLVRLPLAPESDVVSAAAADRLTPLKA
jgi:two-component system, OmpR family, sensor histidine kinase MtrB